MTYSFGGRVRRLAAAGAATAVDSLALAGGALADPPSNTGPFVIGDQNAAIGSQVTFWGARSGGRTIRSAPGWPRPRSRAS
jgi:hypothetical protein